MNKTNSTTTESAKRKRENPQSHLDGTEGNVSPKTYNRYNNFSKAPFVVLITYNDNKGENNSKNIGNLHPMDVGRVLRNKDAAIKRIDRKGANLIQITYNNALEANNMIENQKEWLPQNWLAYIPDWKTTRIGVGKGIKTSLTEEQIREGLSWDHQPIKIIRIERFTRPPPRNNSPNIQERIPTETIKFVFEGERLPTQLKIFKTIVKITPFEPRLKQCRNCQRLGHLEKQCRGKIRCPICAEEHGEKDCDKNKTFCANCKEQHRATDRNCRVKTNMTINNKVSSYMNINKFDARKLIKMHGLNTLEETNKWIKIQPKSEDNWIFPNNHTLTAWLPSTWQQLPKSKNEEGKTPTKNKLKRMLQVRRKIRRSNDYRSDDIPQIEYLNSPDEHLDDNQMDETGTENDLLPENDLFTENNLLTQQSNVLAYTNEGLITTNIVALELFQDNKKTLPLVDSSNKFYRTENSHEMNLTTHKQLSQRIINNEIMEPADKENFPDHLTQNQ